MPSFPGLKQIRWYQWVLAALVLLYIIYIALSYLYLPGKLTQVVQTDVAELIGREITVSRFRFNPFTLSLEIEELSVADEPGAPLVGWQRLFVNFSFWKSLFKWEVALKEFAIDRPEINVRKDPEGMNFQDILERLAAGAEPEADTEPPGEKTRLALEVDRTAINQGTFRYADLSGEIPAHSDLNDVTIEVHDLYLATGDEQLNPFDLTAKLPGGGDMRLSGRYRIDPLHVEAEISAAGVQLAAFSEFGENIIPMQVENGLLSFSTRLLAKQEEGLQIETEAGRLELTDLDLADSVPDPPMFRADAITVAGVALDLAAKSVSVEEVTLDSLLANQWIDPEGTLRYETLLANAIHQKVTEEPQAPESQSPWQVVVHRIALQNSAVNFSDQRMATVQTHNLSEISLTLENFTLTPNESTALSFSARLDQESQIRADGDLVIDPLQVDAEISADKLQLSALNEYLKDIVHMTIQSGELSFGTRVVAEKADGFQLRTDQGRLEITALDLADETPDPALLQVDAITVAGAALDLSRRRVLVERVALDSILGTQWMDADGRFRYQDLLPETETATGPASAPASDPEAAAPWEVVVRQIALQNSTFHFSDLSQSPPQQHSLSDISLALENVTLTPDESTTFSFSALLDQASRIGADGDLVLSPFAMAANYRLEDLQLPSFSTYVEAASHLRIGGGRLQSTGDVALNQGEKEGLTGLLNLSLNGLETVDTRTGEAVLNLEAFDLKDIAVDTGEQTISVGSLDLTAPELFARMSPEKQINLATLSKPGDEQAPPKEKETVPEKTGEAWRISVLSTGIAGGVVHFTDRSVTPEYDTSIEELTLEVGTIATDATDPAPFSLTGTIDRYAPLAVTGTLLPLDQQPGFTLSTTLEGLEMPSLSPYSAAFIGNNLRSGKLSLDLDYSLADRKLKGKNNIVAENLYLGEKVPSDTATKAPVAMGLALLRDLHGVIDLDVGVAGDLDDPGFSISGIIAKALLNIITKAATSPFKLLGALVGGDENLGDVEFAAGAATLAPEAEARLEKLSEALAQRPQLALEIQGNASKEEDTAALKARQVLEQGALVRDLSPEALEAEAGETNWWEMPENRDALKKMGKALDLATVSERKRLLQAETPELKGDELLAEVYDGIYKDLLDAQEIAPAQLLSLADARALAIKQYLVDSLGLDHSRVSVTKAREDSLKGRTLTLEIGAM